MALPTGFIASLPLSLSPSTRMQSKTAITRNNIGSFQQQFTTTIRVNARREEYYRPSVYMSSEAQVEPPENSEEKPLSTTPSESPEPDDYTGPFGWFKRLIANRDQLKASTLRNYGIAAFISYGLFDLVTYSISFLLSLRAYIATGNVLTWKTLPQVLALMWGINNLSRPFRIAGAIALAPAVDRRVVKPIGAFISRLRQSEN